LVPGLESYGTSQNCPGSALPADIIASSSPAKLVPQNPVMKGTIVAGRRGMTMKIAPPICWGPSAT
jgi:hypothetical protein